MFLRFSRRWLRHSRNRAAIDSCELATSPDHALGDVEDAAGAAGEVEVAADVRAREATHRRPGQRTQPVERADDDPDFRTLGEPQLRPVGQHELDRHAQRSVAVFDQLRERRGHTGAGGRTLAGPEG